MTRLAVAAAVAASAVAAGCGAKARPERPVHYDVAAALTCLTQTDAFVVRPAKRSVLLLFSTDDSVVLVPIAAAFGHGHDDARGRLEALRRGRFGRLLDLRVPLASGGAGDAAFDDYGARISRRAAKRIALSRDAADREGGILRARARLAVETCLATNRRGAAARHEATPPSPAVAVCLGSIAGAESVAYSPSEVVARLYRDGAVGYPVVVGSRGAAQAAVGPLHVALTQARLDGDATVVWRAAAGRLVALGLDPVVDRSAVAAGHLRRTALAAQASTLRARVEPRVRRCLRR
jgi:hypothetical protein